MGKLYAAGILHPTHKKNGSKKAAKGYTCRKGIWLEMKLFCTLGPNTAPLLLHLK